MSIPTEPIGSIPRPRALQEALAEHAEGRLSDTELAKLQQQATTDTLARLEELGSDVVVDGDQAKPSSITYPLPGLSLARDGVVIPYADGHTRQLPRLTAGPFRYQVRADTYLRAAKKLTDRPVKQAVVAPSALSLLYPVDRPIAGYSREAFLNDLANEAEAEIRGCLEAGAHCVQLDFTEARLSLKLDPSGGVLNDLIALNNKVLSRFTAAEQARLGVHTCPGADHDSTHSLDIDYAGLLPRLFQLKVGNFYLQLASEPDPERVLKIISDQLRPGARVFIGVIDPISTTVETPEEVRDRVLLASRYIPVDQLGTCDDAGFSPYADDTSTSRDLAFAKIEAHVRGTALASQALGL
ncbi:cobalamin-independent methionine synthase II family protein [Streptomyces sp. NPDC085481]|uniref:cobalamin-independent methionine synthase II family protein n=1 Tax=Streptomyces sp. NPDC085481 TaxID=3365727 RepID=UPI0037D79895